MAVGVEVGLHVFSALLAMLSAAALLTAIYTGSKDKTLIKALAIAVAVFVWISWFTVAPVYTQEYGTDKALIKSYEETLPAHAIGMETKEHIFFTGVWLATLLPIFALTMDLDSPITRRLMMWTLVTLIIGGLIMDAIGAWIGISAKLAWQMKSGG